MRVAVFGATGRTGRLVVEAAIDRGYQVVAAVGRAPDPFDERVQVAAVDFAQTGSIEKAISGTEAVISALGPVASVTRTEISEAPCARAPSIGRSWHPRISRTTRPWVRFGRSSSPRGPGAP
jgi:uncharacterized protein YbjT (DUF2867 family)